MTSFQQTKNKK